MKNSMNSSLEGLQLTLFSAKYQKALDVQQEDYDVEPEKNLYQ